jgi:hypothetical protein
MLSITKLGCISGKWRNVFFIFIITFLHFFNCCSSSKWLGWLSESLWLLECLLLLSRLIVFMWYWLWCSAPVRVTGFVERLQELLFSLQWAIFYHMALLTTIETSTIGVVCFLIIISICFICFNISSVHLSKYWQIYIHWDWLIIRMTSRLMSSIVIIVLPFIMMSTKL